jgi:hypothetical protein
LQEVSRRKPLPKNRVGPEIEEAVVVVAMISASKCRLLNRAGRFGFKRRQAYQNAQSDL